jgi:hypothetical protein
VALGRKRKKERPMSNGSSGPHSCSCQSCQLQVTQVRLVPRTDHIRRLHPKPGFCLRLSLSRQNRLSCQPVQETHHHAQSHHPPPSPAAPPPSDIRPRSEYRHLQPSLLHHQQPSFADQHSPLPRLLCPLGVFCLPLRVNLEIPIFAREHRVLTHAPRRPDSHRRRSVEYVFSLTSNTL